MPSSLTWIVHDPDESDRVNRILAALRQAEARDELGFGGIRDSLADRLFPGTSTIQTRLRYFLIVPWCYQHVEALGVRAPRFAEEVAALERRLIAPLLEQDDADGVFGRVAGRAIKRLPSSVYWSGLGSLGLRRVELSQGVYHREVDRFLARRGRVRRTEDGEAIADPGASIWHPAMPPAPPGFPGRLDFQLTPTERSFLIERIHERHASTMLGWLTRRDGLEAGPFPWAIPSFAELPADTQELLDQARLVSEVAHGAAQLYNLSLAELPAPAEGQERLTAIAAARREDLARWRAGALRLDRTTAWDLGRLEKLCTIPGHSVSAQTWTFLGRWRDRVVATGGHVEDDAAARALVREREQRLKGGRGRSRFHNATMRAAWAGAAGIQRLDFRWAPVQGLLRDLLTAAAT